jgi:hypothetical protein
MNLELSSVEAVETFAATSELRVGIQRGPFVFEPSCTYSGVQDRLSSGFVTVSEGFVSVVWFLGRFCTAAQERQIPRRPPTSFARCECPLPRLNEPVNWSAHSLTLKPRNRPPGSNISSFLGMLRALDIHLLLLITLRFCRTCMCPCVVAGCRSGSAVSIRLDRSSSAGHTLSAILI